MPWVIDTEATNAILTPDAIHGVVPSFFVMDASVYWQSDSGWSVRWSVDNLNDARYFTRRAAAYPGPGILPADGRSIQLTVG